MEEKVVQEVVKAAKDGKLACGVALEIAKNLGCDTALVGKAANDNKIKIVSCSLGCF